MKPSTLGAAVYCLHGDIDGNERTFELAEGQHTIGSSRSADVVLAVAGVSRRHALLTVTANELIVEDLGSTNGTQLDGTRVQHGSVPAGSELRLGPVRLRVERLEPEDAELAIDFAVSAYTDAQPSLTQLNGEEVTLVVDETPGDQAAKWLQGLEAFITRLTANSSESLTDALESLGETLAASGCCVVQWPPVGEPLALAAWGTIHAIPPLEEARSLAQSTPADATARAATATPCGAGFFASLPPASAAVCRRADESLLGLVVWGRYPGQAGSGSLLRALARLITASLPDVVTRGPTSQNTARYPDLIFPPAYRPGASPPMVALYSQMRPLLDNDLPVLISGETGVGKEPVARILHASSTRRDGPLVAVNCAAIPSELLEAEMFGIGKGVATGVEARVGKFQLAEGGTLFLDEIGEMAPSLQAKLLRVLQEKEVHPLGGRPRSIDLRVVAATNVDLARQMEQGTLRADLYYRLAGFVLEVPPLRRCPEDIPGLVEHFLRIFSAETGIRARGLTVAALRRLAAYPWPGNIRELEHETRRLIYSSRDGDVIGMHKLSARLLEPGEQPQDTFAKLGEAFDDLQLAPTLEALEEHLIRRALARVGGKKIAACRLLGLSRNGLDKKMKRLGIEVESPPEDGRDPT